MGIFTQIIDLCQNVCGGSSLTSVTPCLAPCVPSSWSLIWRLLFYLRFLLPRAAEQGWQRPCFRAEGQPLGAPGPHQNCLGPHVQHTNTNDSWCAREKRKVRASLLSCFRFVYGIPLGRPQRRPGPHVARRPQVGHACCRGLNTERLSSLEETFSRGIFHVFLRMISLRRTFAVLTPAVLFPRAK